MKLDSCLVQVYDWEENMWLIVGLKHEMHCQTNFDPQEHNFHFIVPFNMVELVESEPLGHMLEFTSLSDPAHNKCK